MLAGGARRAPSAPARTKVSPRAPRSGSRQAARAQAPARPPHSATQGRSGPRTVLLTLLALLALGGGVIAVVVVATAPAPTQVKLRSVVYSDVEQASLGAAPAGPGKHQITAGTPRSAPGTPGLGSASSPRSRPSPRSPPAAGRSRAPRRRHARKRSRRVIAARRSRINRCRNARLCIRDQARPGGARWRAPGRLR